MMIRTLPDSQTSLRVNDAAMSSLSGSPTSTGQSGTSCVLCRCSEVSKSWVGTIQYSDNKYRYLECAACGSLFCSPMPDNQTVATLYGSNYVRDVVVKD